MANVRLHADSTIFNKTYIENISNNVYIQEKVG